MTRRALRLEMPCRIWPEFFSRLVTLSGGGRESDTYKEYVPVKHAFPTQLLDKTRTRVMGIFNATPDSFFDGGHYREEAEMRTRMRRIMEEGADIVDIGAESSRPDASPVSLEEELRRAIPAWEAALSTGMPVSVDTCKAAVARRALQMGAAMINDISALRHDAEMREVVAEFGCLCVLMHMQGTPKTMQVSPVYKDVVSDVYDFLARRIEFALQGGIAEDRIWIDPGFGFGKTVEHNLELLRRLDIFQGLGCPIVMGTSNKSMIGAVLGAPLDDRQEGTAATVAIGITRGVHCVRVHDVKVMARVVRMCDAVLDKGSAVGTE